jgi:hypothetical protein
VRTYPLVDIEVGVLEEKERGGEDEGEEELEQCDPELVVVDVHGLALRIEGTKERV